MTKDSLIFVTFQRHYRPVTRYWIDRKEADQRFTITLDQPTATATTLSWCLINNRPRRRLANPGQPDAD